MTYVYALRDQVLADDNLKKSAFLLTSLMQTFDNIGSYGDSSELVAHLRAIVKESDRGAYWQDNESNFKVMGSSDYVTSLAYLAMGPLEHWDLKAKVRNWMLDRDTSSYFWDPTSERIIYSLAVADSQSVFDLNKASELEVFVNGASVGKVSVEASNKYSRFKMGIPAEAMKSGENIVSLKRSSGEGDLYVLLSANKNNVATATTAANFTIKKTYIDLDSGTVIDPTKLAAQKLVKVRLEVTPQADGDNIIVRDQFAAGVAPRNLNFSSLSWETLKTYNNDSLEYVNRYGGNIATDYITFVEPSMKKGKTYKFEYLAQSGFAGDYDGGLVSVSVELFPDIVSIRLADKVTIK